MIDLRHRSIDMKIGEQWYAVTFQPRVFGRVKDVKVWNLEDQEDSSHLVFMTLYKTETKFPDYTTAYVFKEVLRSIKSDIVLFFRKMNYRRQHNR